MNQPAFIYDYIRTPIGRFGGALSSIRADDLAALPIKALMERNDSVDWATTDDVVFGCANQAGEDNRNVARMALLLAGLPKEVSGLTLNRLCGSGMEGIGHAARTIWTGENNLLIAGGVESMSRAPLVMAKSEKDRLPDATIYDTTLGWRFVNSKMKEMYGVDSMPETGENVASEFGISREDQDAFALSSHQKAVRAQSDGILAQEIIPVAITNQEGDSVLVDKDEHPRADTSLEKLATLKTPFREEGTITAGNCSGVNDGAAALLVGSESVGEQFGLSPIAKVSAIAVTGVEPRIMGMGPFPATEKLLTKTGLKISEIDLIELNEAFASQSLAVLRQLGISDNADHVNINGGAIALGHPLGMSGARITGTVALELKRKGLKRAIATMCIGVGQGIAILIEAV
jgi:acetyl-CoA acyltransferase